MTTTKENELRIPEGLSQLGRTAAELLVRLVGPDASTGGCRAFYTPAEWAERSEQHLNGALLIVVHDGGCFAPLLNYDYCQYADIERTRAALAACGLYAEGIECWYSAIYSRSR